MNRKRILIGLLFVVTIILAGCNMRTIDQMYCLPKRPEGYLNLQSAMDSAMAGLEYHAPITGEHQQPVQQADLDGDGNEEFLVFAKGSGEKPLKILIFKQNQDEYVLADTLENNGTAFDQVQYVKFTGRAGYDIIIGRQLSEQVVRPVSVYNMVDGKMEQILTTQYTRFLSTDFDGNGHSELMILRPGEDPAANGIAELYSVKDGVVERSQEVTMSEPADHIKRIMISRLNDGPSAVYVASDVNGSAIITDVYALLNGTFTNVSLSNESGTSMQTLRNYYVYADDLDKDGVLELPDLIPLVNPDNSTGGNQHLIRWYSMNSDGTEVDKLHTYHSFTGGWYLELPAQIAGMTKVSQFGNSYEFFVTNKDGTESKLMTVYVFTGQEREEQAIADNRFVLYRTESTVYAGHLEVASAAFDMTQETLINAFHLITLNPTNTEMERSAS